MTSWVMRGVREIDLMTASLPCSMRFAIETSPSRVSKRDRAHLAEVHPDRIVGLVERARRGIEVHLLAALALELLVAVRLLRVDDLDASTAERAEEVVELLGRGDVRREELVHFVIEQVALLFAERDELSNLVVFFFDGQSGLPCAGQPY